MADAGGADAEHDADDVEAQMQAMMGFGGFGTTKQKKVQGNDAYAVAKSKSAQYRQYMYGAPFLLQPTRRY
jgi:U4/U6.U5 tri-snRNP-associated protein 3